MHRGHVVESDAFNSSTASSKPLCQVLHTSRILFISCTPPALATRLRTSTGRPLPQSTSRSPILKTSLQDTEIPCLNTMDFEISINSMGHAIRYELFIRQLNRTLATWKVDSPYLRPAGNRIVASSCQSNPNQSI